MNRNLLWTVLGAAAVFAAGYLVWTTTHKNSPPAPTPVAKMPAKPRTAPASRAVAPPVAPAAVAEPAPAPLPAIDPAALAISDPDAFVKGLSAEQNKKLFRLLNMKLGDPITEAQKYQLDADMSLMMLGRNPKLALTDGQKQKLADIKAAYRTKMDAALGDKYAQVDEIDRKISEIYANATSQRAAGWDSQDLRAKQFEIMGAINQAKTAFEADYQFSVRAYLTPDQAQAFDDFNRRKAAGAAALNQMADQIRNATPANGVVQP